MGRNTKKWGKEKAKVRKRMKKKYNEIIENELELDGIIYIGNKHWIGTDNRMRIIHPNFTKEKK